MAFDHENATVEELQNEIERLRLKTVYLRALSEYGHASRKQETFRQRVAGALRDKEINKFLYRTLVDLSSIVRSYLAPEPTAEPAASAAPAA